MKIPLCFALAATLTAAAPPVYRDKVDLLYYNDSHGTRHEVRSKAGWNKRRAHAIANMKLVMGPLPCIDHKLPLQIEVLKEVRTAKYTWRRITYVSQPGDRAYAYLYLPHDLKPTRKTPAIVSLHGTTYRAYVPPSGPSGDPHYAHELAEQGYVVIAPDYVLLSDDYKTDPYKLGYVSGTMKGIVNHIRAVDVLVSMPEVNPKRIGAIGLSLGGHNALFLGVFDPRVRAIVTSAGFNRFHKYYGGNLTGWTSTRYMPRIATEYGKDADRVPFDFPEILGALAPRAVFVNAPLSDSNFEVSGVRDCVDAAKLVYEKIFHLPERLFAMYPEGGHGFSRPAREAAYAFLAKWL